MNHRYGFGVLLLIAAALIVAIFVAAWAWGTVFDVFQVPDRARLALIVLWAMAAAK